MDLLIPFVWLLVTVNVMAATERTDITGDREKTSTGQEILETLLQRSKYSKSEVPILDQPTKVEVGIYINSFYSINAQNMDYSVSMYLRQAWQDKRLEFSPDLLDQGHQKIRLGEDSWNKIWVPDTFFRNEKEAKFHFVTIENRLLTVNASGHVWYVIKLTATLSCPMKLQKYPFDTQHCPMMFESYGYTMDSMYFSWLPSPVDIDPGLQLPQFTLTDRILFDCSQNYTAGSFPCLEIQFVFRRESGFFVMQIYVPTLLIVLLSWVAFWIDIEATTARVLIGLFTILAMTTQSTGANASLPTVSYVKAIDIWFIVCLLFVFSSLLEFAVINVLSRRNGKKGAGHKESTENGKEKCEPQGPDSAANPIATRIDWISRILFPVAFLLFNIIYWSLYAA